MKNKVKSGISLIVLVVTIIVLSILAATVIITLSNTNVINQASQATFKTDMANYKEAYEMYVASKIAENSAYDRVEDKYEYGTNATKLDEIFAGNVSERYKNGLKIEYGKVVYETTDEGEKAILKELDMEAPKYIDKTGNTTYIGSYADVDGDGIADGIIFADLIESKPDEEYFGVLFSYEAVLPANLKEYIVLQENYNNVEGVSLVQVQKGQGSKTERFYVVAFEDLVVSDCTWYANGDIESIYNDYLQLTNGIFGDGKGNTDIMVEKWNASAYGAQSETDIWYGIQDTTSNPKCNYYRGWFVPSSGELAALGYNFSITPFSDPMSININIPCLVSCIGITTVQALTEDTIGDLYITGDIDHDDWCNVRLITTF